MSILRLALNGEYFDAIKRGDKTEEYRLTTDYWRKRLEGREYDMICLTRGYPSASDTARHILIPYRGYEVKTITHKHFGSEPVEVFAINVKVGVTP